MAEGPICSILGRGPRCGGGATSWRRIDGFHTTQRWVQWIAWALPKMLPCFKRALHGEAGAPDAAAAGTGCRSRTPAGGTQHGEDDASKHWIPATHLIHQPLTHPP